MTLHRDNEILLELKYCERCGGLFFREENSGHRLCRPCLRKSASAVLPVNQMETGAPRRKPQSRAGADWYGPMSKTVERLQGVAAGGVA